MQLKPYCKSGEQRGGSKGASLVTTIISLVFAGFALVILGWFISAETSWFRNMTTESQKDALESYQKEIVVEGFDPNRGSNALSEVALETPETSDLFSVNNAGALTVDHVGSNSFSGIEQTVVPPATLPDGTLEDPGAPPEITYKDVDPMSPGGGIGALVLPNGTSPIHPQIKLEPPIVTTTGLVPVSGFPVTGWMDAHPDNPPGTVYRYAFNGYPVMTTSIIYRNDAPISLANLPTQIQVMATHPDTERYLPSDILVFVIQAPINVEYARADGGTDTAFTFYEATGAPNTEGIVLTMDRDVPGTVHYTLDGTDPDNNSRSAPQYMLPTLAEWATAAGFLELRAIANPSAPQWIPGSILIVPLAAVSVQLEPPTLGVSSGQTIRDGDAISSDHANPYAIVDLDVGGLFSAQQRGDPWFTISLPKVEYPN